MFSYFMNWKQFGNKISYKFNMYPAAVHKALTYPLKLSHNDMEPLSVPLLFPILNGYKQ